jgi:regulator of RNase E activity RraB
MAALLSFSDEWDFYPCKIDDESYSVRFNVGALNLEDDERAGFPHTMKLTIPFLEAREHGFPTHGELERINKIEDALELEDDSVRHIGVITGNGAVRFIFCGGGDPDELEAKGRKLMSGQSAEYSVQIYPDDNFDYYDRLLAPSPYDANWISDRNVCDNLERHGDDLTTPREVDFYIRFQNEKDIDPIAAELTRRGLTEAGREQTEVGDYGLSMVLMMSPDLDSVNGITSDILALLEDVDAEFDGWGCTVVKG